MRFRLGAVAVLLALSTGCDSAGNSSEDGSRPSVQLESTVEQPSPAPPPALTQCTLLAPKTVEELAGEQLDGAETTIPGSDLPACSYGRLDQVGVQVVQVSASQWARALPDLVDELKAMGALGEPEILRQLEKAKELIESGKTVPPNRACALFSDMLQLQGAPAGRDRNISYLPGREDPLAMSVQACLDGTYTSIVVGKPDLQVSQTEEDALAAALATIA